MLLQFILKELKSPLKVEAFFVFSLYVGTSKTKRNSEKHPKANMYFRFLTFHKKMQMEYEKIKFHTISYNCTSKKHLFWYLQRLILIFLILKIHKTTKHLL
jgi:hypothetical protein